MTKQIIQVIFEIATHMAALEMKLKALEQVLTKEEIAKIKEELKARLRAKL